MTDRFPEREGKWEGEIKGYQVVKETSAEKIGKEKFIISYKDHGEKTVSSAHGIFRMKLAANFTGKGVGTEERQYYKEEGRP
ncbi:MULTISPECIES: hypothetical protein [Bacillus]|uniref:hypothetical protein n=1 Tax=Bacillus TaxID=1386 RepID=UPI0020058F58|nr:MULTISPECIES: hypothetical protein [Bacillus]MCK6208072.1 hypothetical protein [Bacillus infantis]MDT0162539.1 hypothetical protein [Bacillus sp. AG4(2022)]